MKNNPRLVPGRLRGSGHDKARISFGIEPLRDRLSLSHLSQPAEVRCNPGEECLVRVVLDPEFPARLLNQLADPRVVDVTDAREEVVLDLEIQSAEEPAEHR